MKLFFAWTIISVILMIIGLTSFVEPGETIYGKDIVPICSGVWLGGYVIMFSLRHLLSHAFHNQVNHTKG